MHVRWINRRCYWRRARHYTLTAMDRIGKLLFLRHYHEDRFAARYNAVDLAMLTRDLEYAMEELAGQLANLNSLVVTKTQLVEWTG